MDSSKANSETHSRYLDSDAYARAEKRYQKQRALWYNLKLAGTMLCVLGGALLGTTTLDSSYLEPIMLTLVNVGSILVILGIITTMTVPKLITKHRIDEVPYQFALHFMTDMGIQDPKKLLHANPRYVEAFEEVREATTALEANHSGVRYSSKSISPNARRLGSLVLRDERSLELTARLLELIEQRGLSDYDSLAELLDDHDNHPTALTDGVL